MIRLLPVRQNATTNWYWNGIAYYVIVAVPVMRDAMGIGWPGAIWVRAGGWVLVATTVASMVGRLRFARTAE